MVSGTNCLTITVMSPDHGLLLRLSRAVPSKDSENTGEPPARTREVPLSLAGQQPPPEPFYGFRRFFLLFDQK